MKSTIRILGDSIKDRKRVQLSMVMENIYSKEMGPTMKGSGETTRLKEKENLTLDKVRLSTQESGKLMNIMVGEHFTLTQVQTINGRNMKESSRMASNKDEDK